MKLYGGIDLRSNNCVFNLVDEEGRVVLKKRLSNNLEMILGLLDPHRDALAGLVVESTYNWYWLVDGLMEAGYKVHLANTTAIQQYSGLKHADDDSDANWLANMLRLGILPEGYIYPKEERMLRDLLRKRLQLVQQKTSNLLSIQGLYDRHLNKRLSGKKVKQLTEEQLVVDYSDVNVRMAVNGNLVILNCLAEQVRLIERSLKQRLKLSHLI
jgi:transposase